MIAWWDEVQQRFKPAVYLGGANMTNIDDGKNTRIIAITAAGTEIIAHRRCRRIRVQENYTSAIGPTTDLGMEEPEGADEVIILKGTPAVFTAPGPNGAYHPGTIVGVVACLDVAGPVEGQQIEDQLI